VCILANKEKLLLSAQKYLQKGQFSKAIKDYRKIVEIDPKDVRNRQKLAELYGRNGQTDLAYSEYEIIARYYSENDHYPKAIAVFKQMQRLDPGQSALCYRLAELNEKQGLVGNALAEYRRLIKLFERQNKFDEIASVLQKMKSLDPGNLNIRVKIIEIYGRLEMQEKARTEMDKVLLTLHESKDYARLLKVHEIFLQQFPDDINLSIDRAHVLVLTGHHNEGIELLEPLSIQQPENQQILSALAQGQHRSKRYAEEQQTYKTLLGLEGGNLTYRKGLIETCISLEQYEEALSELEIWKEDFFTNGLLDSLKPYYETLRKVLPRDPRISNTLRSIYETTGEGDKLFDIISEFEKQSVPELEPQADVTLETSLFDTAVEDLTIEGSAAENVSPEYSTDAAVVDEKSDKHDFFAIEKNAPEENLLETEAFPVPEFDSEEEFELSEEIDLEIDFEDDSTVIDGENPEERIAEPTTEELSDEGSSLEESADEEKPITLDEAIIAFGGDAEEPAFVLPMPEGEDNEELSLSLSPPEEETIELPPSKDPMSDKVESPGNSLPVNRNINDSGYFDLAAEIFKEEPDVFNGDEGDFEFNDDVVDPQQVNSEEFNDAESHFNLGVAYKEMGLLEDAIVEFQEAMKDESRRVDCLTFIGMTYVERGFFQKAEGTLTRAVLLLDADDTRRPTIQYDMGQLYMKWGRPLEALDSFQYVVDIDPEYRDARDKVIHLRDQLGLDPLDGEDTVPEETQSFKENRISYL